MAIGTPVTLGNTNGSIGNTVVLTTTATANTGDTIIVAIAGNSTATVSGVADSAGNTYVQDETLTNTVEGYIFRATNITQLSSGGTITVTKNTNLGINFGAIAVSGLATASPLDQHNNASGNSTTPSVAITTTNASDIVIGAVMYRGTGTDTQPGGSWTALTGAAVSNFNLGWSYRIESATGTFTYNPTLAPSTLWVALEVSYKGAVAAGSSVRQLMLLGVGI